MSGLPEFFCNPLSLTQRADFFKPVFSSGGYDSDRGYESPDERVSPASSLEDLSELGSVSSQSELAILFQEFKQLMIDHTAIRKDCAPPGKLSSYAFERLSEYFSDMRSASDSGFVVGVNFDFKPRLTQPLTRLNIIYEVLSLLRTTDPELYQKIEQGGVKSYWHRWADIARRFLIQKASKEQGGLVCQIQSLSDQVRALETELETLKAEFQVNQDQKQQAQAELEQKNKEIQALYDQWHILQQDYAALWDFNAHLKQEAAAQAAVLEGLETDLQALRVQLQLQAKTLEQLRAKEQVLESALHQSEAEKTAALEDLARYQACQTRGLAYEEPLKQGLSQIQSATQGLDLYLQQTQSDIQGAAAQAQARQDQMMRQALIRARLAQKIQMDVVRLPVVTQTFRQAIQRATELLRQQEQVIRASWYLWIFRSQRNKQLQVVQDLKHQIEQVVEPIFDGVRPKQVGQAMKRSAQRLDQFLNLLAGPLSLLAARKKKYGSLQVQLRTTITGALESYHQSNQCVASSGEALAPIVAAISSGASAYQNSLLAVGPFLAEARGQLAGLSSSAVQLAESFDRAKQEGVLLYTQ